MIPDKVQATKDLIALSDNYKKELELMQNEYNKNIPITLHTKRHWQKTSSCAECKS